ncbi:molybdenum cofactor biosynthesis protein F [Kocuria coralli]|uniref:Molybdenum cofactor biosynthesis protein F n=1 Tax=Kocuria coralli TaxID=1461025 RepID=A0A5J5KZY1_9MICC|nr:MoaF C-terminal domain-containing protein [Kocuria coralli]KAA9394920.1 molybdenum cofactor biosynthesis protein F [Kocuria coralli]
MTESFIPVGALGHGFAPEAEILEPVTDLAGRTFTTDIEGLASLVIGDGVASWGENRDVPVRVTSVRPRIYLVDGVVDAVSTSFVLDTEAGLITVVEGELPDAETRAESAYTRVQRGDEPTGVVARFTHGYLDGSSAPVHAPTTELVGLRNHYRYSPTESYEHVYLTPTLYTWHCIEGVERDLADTDACHHIGIDEKLTLFVWREKIVPTLGLILIDLDAMRTDGKIFGNDGFDADSLANFPVGATAAILNTTTY